MAAIYIVDNFGAEMKRIRLESGLNQREVAKRVGINRGSLSKIERNVFDGSIETRIKLLKAINPDLEIKLAIVDPTGWLTDNIKTRKF